MGRKKNATNYHNGWSHSINYLHLTIDMGTYKTIIEMKVNISFKEYTRGENDNVNPTHLKFKLMLIDC